jgi:BCCT, betaine/carnitine/choline family transporter
MFVSKISQGRTLGELFLGLVVIPTIVCLFWYTVWGGIAIRQARQAMEMEQLGTTYFNNSGHLLVNGSSLCYNVPQHDIIVDGQVVFHNNLPGITPVCRFDVDHDSRAFFDILHSFSYPETLSVGFGPALSVVAMIGIALYSITAYDSAALVMHYLSSNGEYILCLLCICCDFFLPIDHISLILVSQSKSLSCSYRTRDSPLDAIMLLGSRHWGRRQRPHQGWRVRRLAGRPGSLYHYESAIEYPRLLCHAVCLPILLQG